MAKRVVAKKSKKPARKSPPKAKKKVVSRKPSINSDPFDFSAFPPEVIQLEHRGFCLACTLDIFTRHLGLAPARAQSEMKRHQITIDEVASSAPTRPYFPVPARGSVCPYCGAPEKWLTEFPIARIESGKATDTLRRSLVKKLGTVFTVLEEKSTQRDALYDWLAKTGAGLDLENSSWLLDAARHWLGRRLPKEDWALIFQAVHYVRRSRRLDDGFEIDGPRLFLSPHLFDEVLLIQYLLSRSHKAGGWTFEGRLTLPDLFRRLRGGGYLRSMGVVSNAPSDALEKLMELLGGESSAKYYYIVDRRLFLAKLEELKSARIPKPKTAGN